MLNGSKDMINKNRLHLALTKVSQKGHDSGNEEKTRNKVVTHRAKEMGNQTIWKRDRLEFHTMDPLVSIINCSLVHNWSANGAHGSIYETKAVIENCSFVKIALACVLSKVGSKMLWFH